MICRKCGHMWFIQEIPLLEEVECPSCGELISLRCQPYQPDPPLNPDVITDIIIENCFHLKNSWGQVLYDYSEKTLRYLKGIGYEVSGKENHILFLKEVRDR